MQVRELSYEDINEMQQIAKTIRQQIGMVTLMACGARNWRFLENGKRGISFQVGAGSRRHFINIGLEPDDTYTIVSYKLKRITNERIQLAAHTDIYCDQLTDLIYRMTHHYE